VSGLVLNFVSEPQQVLAALRERVRRGGAVGVVKAMADYLFKHNANTHWKYPSSAETDAALDEARRVFEQGRKKDAKNKTLLDAMRRLGA